MIAASLSPSPLFRASMLELGVIAILIVVLVASINLTRLSSRQMRVIALALEMQQHQ